MKNEIICPNCEERIDVKRCYNCSHYTPYYTVFNGDYSRSGVGFCTYPKMKGKKDGDCCVNWDGNAPTVRGENLHERNHEK